MTPSASKKRRAEDVSSSPTRDSQGISSKKKPRTDSDTDAPTSNEKPRQESKAVCALPLDNVNNKENETASLDPVKTLVRQAEKKRRKRRRKRKSSEKDSSDDSSKVQIRKLVPPRPFPTVPTAANATGPRSSHCEGKNKICITRKTPLGAYLRRCKELILKDGYKTLYLCAMGAAISHLARLTISLPRILPHAPDAIETKITTGTVEVVDEVIPDDEDEDIILQKREKTTMHVVFKIDGGDEEPPKGRRKRTRKRKAKASAGVEQSKTVYSEMDLDEVEGAISEQP